MDWIVEHAQTLSAVTNTGVLVVWALYAHLFYRGVRWQWSPRLIIDQMSGEDDASTCVITNMSQEPVYIICVCVAPDSVNGRLPVRITECNPVSTVDQNVLEIVSRERQGPLAPGAVLTVGTLQMIAQQASEADATTSEATAPTDTVEVCLIATVSSGTKPIGARRSFRIESSSDGRKFKPVEVYTKQMASRSDQKKLIRWLQECVCATRPEGGDHPSL
jgi:hypothetical protein